MRFASALLALALVGTSAAAEDAIIQRHTDSPVYIDGTRLQAMCASDAKTSNGVDLCDAYIVGVSDTIVANGDKIQGYQICWPHPGLAPETLRTMMLAYMKAHPDQLPGVASSLVDGMLFETYHCPGTTAPPG